MATTGDVGPDSLPALRAGRMETRRRLVGYSLVSPASAWLTLFFLLPVAIMAVTSLKSGGILSGGFRFTWEFSNYAQGIAGRRIFFLRSLEFASLTAAGTIVLAFPATYWIAFHGGRWKSTLLFLILVPYFVSFVIRTVEWKFILADTGPVLGPLKNWGLLPRGFHVLATPAAVVGGLIYNYVPFTALPLYVALERIDPALIESAQDLYANGWQAFRRVVLPLSTAGLFAATLLTFVPAMGDYVEAEILGGPGSYMIGNIIQSEFLTRARYPLAASLSIVLMMGMVVLTSIYARIVGTEEATRVAAAP